MITVKEKWESNSDTSIQLLSDNNKKREKKGKKRTNWRKCRKLKATGWQMSTRWFGWRCTRRRSQSIVQEATQRPPSSSSFDANNNYYIMIKKPLFPLCNWQKKRHFPPMKNHWEKKQTNTQSRPPSSCARLIRFVCLTNKCLTNKQSRWDVLLFVQEKKKERATLSCLRGRASSQTPGFSVRLSLFLVGYFIDR